MRTKTQAPIVAIAGTRFGNLDLEKEVLTPLQADIVEVAGGDEKSLAEMCRSAAGIIVGSQAHFTAPVIRKLKSCRIIARGGIGVDNIDIQAAAKQGIIVTNVPDYCIDEVSDHAMAFILSFARKLSEGAEEVRKGGWGFASLRPLHRLRGAALGVVGIGRIGATLAQKARGFGMRILAFDPFASEAIFRKLHAEKVTLPKLLKESDYISLHAPLTSKTRGLISTDALRRMKSEAVLVNVSRGELVDEEALAEALKNKVIRGAGLDVLCQEPPDKHHPLADLPNCVITPHSAWYTIEAQDELRRKTAEEVVRVLQGKKPRYSVLK